MSFSLFGQSAVYGIILDCDAQKEDEMVQSGKRREQHCFDAVTLSMLCGWKVMCMVLHFSLANVWSARPCSDSSGFCEMSVCGAVCGHTRWQAGR